jgi:multimeric flavodoxin WrbA
MKMIGISGSPSFDGNEKILVGGVLVCTKRKGAEIEPTFLNIRLEIR